MHVKLDRMIVILAVLSCLPVLPNAVVGQTVAVPLPGQGSLERMDGTGPPNTMTTENRRWESILDRQYPNQFNRTLSGRELVESLNRLGLPMILSRSARDDSLSEREQVVLPLPQSSLRTRLLAGLKEKNATICFRHDRIEIISLDDSEDSDNFFTVTYDVTSLVGDSPYRLIDSIMNSLDPDSWVDTGQGLATIVATEVNGRHLITVSQEYVNHRSLQRFLRGLDRLTRSYQPAHRSSTTRIAVGSKAVVLPRRGNQ